MRNTGKTIVETPEISTARPIEDILNEVMTPASRKRARQKADRILERMRLDELRKSTNTSQRTLAAAMGIDQGEVSRIEKRTELKLGTIRQYIGALGGHVEVRAVFPDRNVELSIAAD